MLFTNPTLSEAGLSAVYEAMGSVWVLVICVLTVWPAKGSYSLSNWDLCLRKIVDKMKMPLCSLAE